MSQIAIYREFRRLVLDMLRYIDIDTIDISMYGY